MPIDWFTVFAQMLNFVVLVWLMKRYLYRPVLDAIAARENRIALELADAAAKKNEAQKEREEFQRKKEEIEQRRFALLNQATDEANAEHQRLLEDARSEAEAFSAKRREMLRNDANNLNQTIGSRTQQEVFAIARKTLMDLASMDLEERMSEIFIRRLKEIDSQTQKELGEAVKTASAPGLVRSVFELSAKQRAAIQAALKESFLIDLEVRFETAPNLISGVEFSINGQKIAWSIADYLASLEKNVGELLNKQVSRG